MIIVTGGAGFIGSNLIAGLNDIGETDILAVDDLKDGKKILNINDLIISDYCDKDDLQFYLNSSSSRDRKKIDIIFHLGACSETTEWDGQFLMRNNYEYSKFLFHWCQDNKVPFIYASSASVYGLGENGFQENKLICEKPINAYAYTKLLFDRYVFNQNRKFLSQVIGLRYFNVYGPRESHKANMVSPAFSFYNQISERNVAKIFKASHGYEDGEHERDFIYVEDCVKVNLWFHKNGNTNTSGIYNVGTGQANSFNSIANEIIRNKGQGEIEYVEMPNHLKNSYQSFTKADLKALRNIGYKEDFYDITTGIKMYYDWLSDKKT